MSIIIFCAIIIAMSAITFLWAVKKENHPSTGAVRSRELTNLYEYKNFLSNALRTKYQLQIKLSAINYGSIPYNTFFNAFEVYVLKNEISQSIESLEEMILHQTISKEDFNKKVEDIQKRISVITLPLDSIANRLGSEYLETAIVA